MLAHVAETAAVEEVTRRIAEAPPGDGLPIPHLDGVEHHHLQVNGVLLHYAEAGEGDPVVLVHGWPQHWWCWRELIGPLAERHRVICPDIRGIGWSEGSARGYKLDALAADVLGLMDALKLERVRLVTHDWGTALGYRAALYWPRRIERFVPLAGVPPWAAEDVPMAWWAKVWHIYVNATAGRYAGPDLFGIPRRVLRTWRHVGEFTPEEVRTYLAPLRTRAAVNATHHFYRNIVFYEIPRAFRYYRSWRLRVPTLHLNGEHDSLTQGVPDSYRRYTDDMRFEELPDCGHFMAEERPQDVLDRLTDFLG
jgi:pimeloyl-ACP methyl ester carboxylesterase